MKFFIDTNIIYYHLQIENNNGVQYDLSKSKNWSLTDLNLLESFNRYGENGTHLNTIVSFFKNNQHRIVNLLNENSDILKIKNFTLNNGAYLSALEDLRNLKKKFEYESLKFSVFLLGICNTYRRIEEDEIKHLEEDIFRAIGYAIKANEDTIKEIIEDKLNIFYKDEKTSKFKTEIQNLYLSIIYVFEWIILSLKHGEKISELKDKINNGEITLTGDSSEKELIKLIRLINKVEKRQKNWVKIDDLLFKSLSLIDFAPRVYPDMPIGYMKYLKILIEKVLTSGKKIHKNDMIDALFLKHYPHIAILTEDTNLKKMINMIDPNLYNAGKNEMKKIKIETDDVTE